VRGNASYVVLLDAMIEDWLALRMAGRRTSVTAIQLAAQETLGVRKRQQHRQE
jgi:hypothetical protein